MAPGPGGEEAWAGLATARSSSARSLHQAPDPSVGPREPPVGLLEDPRGAPEAQYRRLGHDHRHGASPKRARPGAATDRAHLDAVPAAPGPRRALFGASLRGGGPPGSRRRPPAAHAGAGEGGSNRRHPHSPVGGTLGSRGTPPSPPSPRAPSARIRESRPGGLRDSRPRRATHGRLSVGGESRGGKPLHPAGHAPFESAAWMVVHEHAPSSWRRTRPNPS
jgi:hypothetical protein